MIGALHFRPGPNGGNQDDFALPRSSDETRALFGAGGRDVLRDGARAAWRDRDGAKPGGLPRSAPRGDRGVGAGTRRTRTAGPGARRRADRRSESELMPAWGPIGR